MSVDLAYAHWTERGITAVCPTTGDPFISSRARMDTFNGKRGVELPCRHCDRDGHTRTDREFNPSTPALHAYLLDEVRHDAA